jgi:succinate-semialdehyde dehydrogenase/glutarate-semialdehyde dehydrogenase
VLTGVTPEMDAYREEFFGPVGVVYRVGGEDRRSRSRTARRSASARTSSRPTRSRRPASPTIDAGMVYVNIVLADSPELPFGGVKRSGTGARWVCSPPRVRQQEAHPRRR